MTFIEASLVTTIFILKCLGLIIWCFAFMAGGFLIIIPENKWYHRVCGVLLTWILFVILVYISHKY